MGKAAQCPKVLMSWAHLGVRGMRAPSRVSRSAKFVSLSLQSSGTERSPRQELQGSYLREMRELRSDGWPASSFPGGGRGGDGGSGPAGLEELKGRNRGRQRLISCGGSRDSGVQESGEAASALVCLRRCACAPGGSPSVCIRECACACLRLTAPLRREGRGWGGGRLLRGPASLPPLFSSLLFLLFLPPSCSLGGAPPPSWSPASW